jgi:hypothetical protein
MKRIFTLFLICSISLLAQAQERYLDKIFTEVEVSTEVYGLNATVIQLATAGEAVPQPLVMDVYQPVGDTETNRPFALVLHTGNFLPQGVNQQIPGSFRDEVMVDICTELAQRGYVAATADYRTGWNPGASTQPLRALGIIQAAYRGVQDGNTAVRFMRALAQDGGNPYNIDPTRITAIGQGTGGYIVYGMVGLDNYEEILTTESGPAKFLLDTDGDGAPETPMVVPVYHGDVEGKELAIAPDGAFGLPAGDTTNYANVPNFANGDPISSRVSFAVTLGGALGDVSWLNDNDIPMVNIQAINDEFAPYNDAVLTVPGSMLNVVRVQGVQVVGQSQLDNGANQIFYDATFDDPTTALARENSAIAGHDYFEGVFPFNLPPNSFGLDEGLGIEWWDPNAPTPLFLGAMGAPWNAVPHPSGAGTFHEVGLLRNENMSAEKARGNLETCMNYILPRACVALDLPCRANFDGGDATEDLLSTDLVSVTPNPASDFIDLKSDKQIISVELMSIEGKVISRVNNLSHHNYRLDNLSALTGMHILNVRFEEGLVSKTIHLD